MLPPTSDRFAFRGAANRPPTATEARSPGRPREGLSSEAEIDQGYGYGGGGQKRRSPLTPRNVLLLLGTLILLLIIVAPLWDATRLIDDPSFAFFVGRSLPVWLVLICLLAVFVYVVTMVAYFWFATPEFQNEHSVIMINVFVITALGLSFLALSQTFISESSAVSQDLFTNCEHGVRTHKLAVYAASLQSLRQSPACASRPSVEHCPGFEAKHPMLGFLKSMESRSKCAGFCAATGTAQPVAHGGKDATSGRDEARDEGAGPAALRLAHGGGQNASQNSTSGSNETNGEATGTRAPSRVHGGNGGSSQDAASGSSGADGEAASQNATSGSNGTGPRHPALLARVGRPRQQSRQVQFTSDGFDFAAPAAPHRGLARALLRFAQSSSPAQAKRGLASVKEGGAMMLAQQTSQRGQAHDALGPAARTLFSNADYKISCEGASARALMIQALSTGRMLYWEGIFLLIIAVFTGLFQTGVLCYPAAGPGSKDAGSARQIRF